MERLLLELSQFFPLQTQLQLRALDVEDRGICGVRNGQIETEGFVADVGFVLVGRFQHVAGTRQSDGDAVGDLEARFLAGFLDTFDDLAGEGFVDGVVEVDGDQRVRDGVGAGEGFAQDLDLVLGEVASADARFFVGFLGAFDGAYHFFECSFEGLQSTKIQVYSSVSGFLRAFFSFEVKRRSTFLTSSAGDRLSGRMPRFSSVSLTA